MRSPGEAGGFVEQSLRCKSDNNAAKWSLRRPARVTLPRLHSNVGDAPTDDATTRFEDQLRITTYRGNWMMEQPCLVLRCVYRNRDSWRVVRLTRRRILLQLSIELVFHGGTQQSQTRYPCCRGRRAGLAEKQRAQVVEQDHGDRGGGLLNSSKQAN